jgi:hypothetical protein
MNTFLLGGGFGYYLQLCFKDKGIESNWRSIRVHGHNPDGSKLDESVQSHGVDQVDEAIVDQFENREGDGEQNTIGIGTLTSTSKQKSPGRTIKRVDRVQNQEEHAFQPFPPMGHLPVVEQAYPPTQTVTPSIYVPPIQGRMEQRELDLLINTIASQLKAQQASSLEAALRILDPAGAFG